MTDSSVLVFDTFCYNGDEILTYRLDYLYMYVDYFVIVEALQNHSGTFKDHYLIDDAIPYLGKYLDKMIIIKLESFPERPDNFFFNSNGSNDDNWWREFYQREVAKPKIKELAEANPYVVLCGDIDEIPDRKIFDNRKWLHSVTTRPMFLKMPLMYYNFKWTTGIEWNKAFIKNNFGFEDIQISVVRIHGDRSNSSYCGWHCSWFMGIDTMSAKVDNIAHSEYNTPRFRDKSYIRNCVKDGIFIFNPVQPTNMQPYEGSLPDGWRKFQNVLELIQK